MSATRYIGPVILAEDIEAGEKIRTVKIYKNEVYKDIELHTYKHVEASGVQDNKVRNAVSADNSEDLDGAVIVRNVEFRNAQLRTKLQAVLAGYTLERATDDITMEGNVYRYDFTVSEKFNDNTLRPLAEYMHRFLVYGALYDWYSLLGSAQASVYKGQLDEIEEQISAIVKGPSIVKRPLQPFGPAEKIY